MQHLILRLVFFVFAIIFSMLHILPLHLETNNVTYFACGDGRAKTAEALLMANADINATCGDNYETARKGKTMIVSLLLRYGCDVLRVNKNKMNTFSITANGATKNHETVIRDRCIHI